MTMTPYESTRALLFTLIDTFHTTYYSTMEFNYPKRFITDVEHAVNPFATIEWTVATNPMDLTKLNYRVKGTVVFNLFARANSGSTIFTNFTDKLTDFFANKTLTGLNFYDVAPYSNKNIPGFDGEMNIIPFFRDYSKP